MKAHDEGLRVDLLTMVERRRVLGLFGGLSAAAVLAACGVRDPGRSATGQSASTPASSTPSGSASSEVLTEVPDETGGPYPADGSNGPNILDDSGVVRSDIRSSFGGSTTVAAGVPLTIRLTVRHADSGDVYPGAAVYAWQCDQEGDYSLYSQGKEQENYLRGIQQVDRSGTAQFLSIFPGCYSGRWPHVHFEVYSDLNNAVVAGPIVKTSQIALPKEACEAVYATEGYNGSQSNLSRVSISSDMVFRDDDAVHQLASMSGSPGSGYTASLTIGV